MNTIFYKGKEYGNIPPQDNLKFYAIQGEPKYPFSELQKEIAYKVNENGEILKKGSTEILKYNDKAITYPLDDNTRPIAEQDGEAIEENGEQVYVVAIPLGQTIEKAFIDGDIDSYIKSIEQGSLIENDKGTRVRFSVDTEREGIIAGGIRVWTPNISATASFSGGVQNNALPKFSSSILKYVYTGFNNLNGIQGFNINSINKKSDLENNLSFKSNFKLNANSSLSFNYPIVAFRKIVYGYYNSSDECFYKKHENEEYSEKIELEKYTLYIDNDTKMGRYNRSGNTDIVNASTSDYIIQNTNAYQIDSQDGIKLSAKYYCQTEQSETEQLDLVLVTCGFVFFLPKTGSSSSGLSVLSNDYTYMCSPKIVPVVIYKEQNDDNNYYCYLSKSYNTTTLHQISILMSKDEYDYAIGISDVYKSISYEEWKNLNE